MGLAKINVLISNVFSGNRGAGKNLIILTSASLVSGYLFAAVTLANIREQEREAHYYNATQMAEGLEFKIDERAGVVPDATESTIFEGFLDGVQDSVDGIEVISAQKLVLKNLLKVAPDASWTRIHNQEGGYDLDVSKVQVTFLKDGSPTVEKFEDKVFAVDLVSKPYTATDYTSIGTGSDGVLYYIRMIGSDKNTNISTEDILDPNFVIDKRTVSLPDDALEQ